MNTKKRRAIFARLCAQNPKPTTELIYHSPFELLISVILSAQATDKSVNIATQELYKVANTPKKIMALGEKKLQEYIKKINLSYTKARNIIKTCEQLITLHNAQVPDNREALEALPGVGRKTANVILNTIFGEPIIAVDTHIFRVANRTKLAPGKNPKLVENALMQVVPKEYRLNAHHWLILHGRYTCIARKPLCYKCIIQDLCEYLDKTPADNKVSSKKLKKHPLLASTQ